MASSVVAALPSLASRLSINSRLRVNASRFLKSSPFSIFLSSAALATIFMSIRNDSTFSFLVAGSICARLGPSSSSARATSLWRISAPLTLASTGLSSARAGRPKTGATARTAARQPVTAREAKPKRRPVFVSGNGEVMQNPCLEDGILKAAGHSPNHGALATRKVCQNDEFPDRPAPQIGATSHVDKPLTQPYLCAIVSTAIALVLLRFWPLNLGLLNSHSLGG